MLLLGRLWISDQAYAVFFANLITLSLNLVILGLKFRLSVQASRESAARRFFVHRSDSGSGEPIEQFLVHNKRVVKRCAGFRLKSLSIHVEADTAN